MTRRRIAFLTAVAGVLFVASMLRATGGRPSLPLDDSFIYFQYAKQAAAGHPLVYQPGDAPTTGATSLPWMLILSLGALLGMGGKAMIFFAMAVGGALLAVTVHAAGETQRALAPRKPGSERPGDLPLLGLPLAAALVLLNGPLQWGAWSGMEIPLFTAAILLAFLAQVRAGMRPARSAALALAALALVRPEGALLALAAVALWCLGALRDEETRRRIAWAALPLAAAAVLPLVAWLATGEARSSGYAAKSLLTDPGLGLVDALRIAALRGAGLSAALLGGIGPFPDGQGLYAYQSEAAALFVPPLAGVLFLVGILPALGRELGEARPGPGALGVAWVFGLIFATCLLEEPDAHFSRYQMPILPVFLAWVAIGVGRIARVGRDSLAGFQRIAPGILLYLGLASSVSFLFFLAAFGDNCSDIDRMQIRFGETLREELEGSGRVAINDAGAIAYFSHHPTLDLVGLTTPGFAGLWRQGSGVLWEKLESLPPGRRPDWFCIFPNWFDFDGVGILRRVGSVRLLRPSIVDAEKVLYRADWSLAGSGEEPRLPAPPSGSWRVVDRLDVADVDSEAAHAFRWDEGGQAGSGGSLLRRAGFPNDPREILDAARPVLGGVSFRIARSGAGAVTLVARSVTGVRARLLLSIDGGAEEPLELYASGGGQFFDQAIAVLPAGSEPAHVSLRVRPEAAGSAPLVLAHLFTVEAAP